MSAEDKARFERWARFERQSLSAWCRGALDLWFGEPPSEDERKSLEEDRIRRMKSIRAVLDAIGDGQIKTINERQLDAANEKEDPVGSDAWQAGWDACFDASTED